MTRRTARLTAICLLALTLIGSSWAAWGQYQSATGNVVGTVGGACNSSSITYGWPDTNGDILKCVSNVWTLVTMPATAGGSNGQVQFNSSNVLAGSANLFWDNTNSRRGIGTTAPATNLEVAGALRLSTSTTDTFTTPQSSSISTKINIPLYNPGAFGQLIAMGLPTGAASTARAITMVDARGSAHQPTLSVLSPDETNIFGLTSEGSNSSFYLKSTNQLGLLVSGTTEGMHIDGSGNITTHGTVATGGAVTISATSPVTRLSVVNDGAQIGSSMFYDEGQFGYNSPGIVLGHTDGTCSGGSCAFISPYPTTAVNGGFPVALLFVQDSGSGYAEKMRIDTNGYIGIGTASAASVLDVGGNISAIDTAADGDTIQVLPGTCTWNKFVQFDNSKGVTLTCQAAGGCIVNYDNTTLGMNGTVAAGVNTHLYRISGFTFNSKGSGFTIWFTTPWQSGIHAVMSRIRIDHNVFNINDPSGDPTAIFFGDNSAVGDYYYGVIDHNTMTSAGSAFFFNWIGGDPDPTPPPAPQGAANNMFVEDNSISITTMTDASAGCSDSWGGANIVWRHNTTHNCLVTSHGSLHAGGPQN